MKTKLLKISRYSTKKDGTPLVSAKGVPFTSVRIEIPEHPGKLVSGFENADTKNWVVGSEVDIEVEQKGEYLNFRVAKKEDKVLDNTETILNRLVGIKIDIEILKAALVLATKPKVVTESAYPTPEDEGIDVDDIPFD